MSARLLLCVALTTACASGAGDKDDVPGGDTDNLPTCTAPGVQTVLADGFTSGTEGVAMTDDGVLYVVNSDQLVRVDADGTKTTVASTPGGVGAAWWHGAVWVASWKNDQGDSEGSLLEITPEGGVTRHPTPDIPKPNFLLPTAWDTLLVSDDFDKEGRIFELDGSAMVSTWTTGVPSPNGMGFSPDGSTLYVVSTFVADPPLTAIAVSDQTAGAHSVLHTFETGSAPDGLVVAADGAVLVAVNLAGRIDVWQDGQIGTVASDLDTPASLVFGRGPFDPCTLVVTSLFGEQVSLVTAGHEGQ